MSLLLQVKGTSPGVVPPNWQARGVRRGRRRGVAPRLPVAENDGCSGQMPVSRMPTITPSPALSWPPRSPHAVGAPMNAGLVSVWTFSSVSG